VTDTTNQTQHELHYIPVRKDWLARHSEEVLDPDLAIIDPHHHLWDRPANRYLLDDILADINTGHNIVSTVFVQCRAFHRADGEEAMKPVGETEFVAGVAAMSDSGAYGATRLCEGIVGHADLNLGAGVERVLEAHQRAGGGRFRGIRHIVAWEADSVLMNPAYTPPRHQLADETFRDGLRTLGRMGLTFDAWLYHPQIDDLTAAARACPATRMVLDHCGGPLGASSYEGRREEEFPRWAQSIRELATCPNVYVKLGGLGMRINGYGFENANTPPSSDVLAAAWKPYIETCIEAFGANRCMFESNFPVDKGSYSYPVFWNTCKKLARSASPDEKADLFAGTAARFYSITNPAAA
jgi:predicted TIM-barrel fold metal-dependent hydrolase